MTNLETGRRHARRVIERIAREMERDLAESDQFEIQMGVFGDGVMVRTRDGVTYRIQRKD